MTLITKITRTLKNISVEDLKKVAIYYKDDVTIEGIIISDQINDLLIDKMNAGEFAKFAENEL